ncbi:MAG: hypothetical protein ABI885_02555 [Gammaproteobacteria bacterium]
MNDVPNDDRARASVSGNDSAGPALSQSLCQSMAGVRATALKLEHPYHPLARLFSSEALV